MDELITDGSFGTMRPFLDSGIYKNAEWIDTDDNLDDWVDVQAQGARRGTALEQILKSMDKAKWESEKRNPFMAEDCALWRESPVLISTSKPPATPTERCQALAGLLKKFKWGRRHLYSTWNRRTGPAPVPDPEAAALLLHADMRQCQFIGNHYGSLALNCLLYTSPSPRD